MRKGRDAKVHSPEADAGEPSEKSQACRGQERAPLKSAFGALAAARLWGRRGFEPRRASPLLKAQSRLALENFGKNSRPDPPKLQHVRSPRLDWTSNPGASRHARVQFLLSGDVDMGCPWWRYVPLQNCFPRHEGTANGGDGCPGFSTNKTVWPSGLRRWLQAPVRKGVGLNPTAVMPDSR